ncbi:MAG: hypothetical protein J3R72DRAFT_510707 [Linnemannia gamsii]|nr:MAG: hypothetical protein J3R72DRAFT_510707 [Linnemannia gamsii]
MTLTQKQIFNNGPPLLQPAQAATFNALACMTDSTFEIRYFHVHGQGGMARTLIVIGTEGHSRLTNDAEVKAANKGPLITDHIVRWIKYHEEHLQANDANGHYVGDKVTLADVKTEYVISMILGVSGEELVSESKTPAIWRVREEMGKIEGIDVWKALEEYKSLDKENFEFLAY